MRKNGGRFIDMSGQTIGQALVLEVNDNYPKEHNLKDKAIYWNCKCLLCGNIFVKEGRKLRKDGCKEGCKECINKRKSKQFSNNLKGLIFNDIYVIDRDDEYKKEHNYKGNDVIWKCKCLTCNSIFYSVGRLIKNRTFQGCPNCYNTKKSKGEIKIENILKENNIKYIYNRSYFPDLIGEGGICLRYDFVLLNDQDKPIRLIEFDGRQHFINILYFGGEDGLLKRQKSDKIKNIYSLKKGIPLIRIKYNEEDLITLENIFSDKYQVINEDGLRRGDI